MSCWLKKSLNPWSVLSGPVILNSVASIRSTAVGKLGVVLAEGRPPRLVVDSSVSGVTSNAHLPNRSASFILDVAKAHHVT